MNCGYKCPSSPGLVCSLAAGHPGDHECRVPRDKEERASWPTGWGVTKGIPAAGKLVELNSPAVAEVVAEG